MQLLQQAVDDTASSDPERVLYIIPRSTRTVDDGFEDITYSRFANAINRAALWLKDNVEGPQGQMLAFIASQDLRYEIFILAANKAGHHLMLLSPRNADDAQKHLLGVGKCRYCLHGTQFETSTHRIVESLQDRVKALKIPEINDVLSTEKVAKVPFDVTWQEQRHKPYVALHTSGTSTGKPKPIILNHGYYAVEELLPSFPKVDGKGIRKVIGGPESRVCHALPLFHVAAIYTTLNKPILQGGAITLLPSETQIEADLVLKAVEIAKCNRLLSSPTIIENLLSRHAAKKLLPKLEMIAFGSGPMPVDVGNALLKLNPHATNMYGSTEVNILPLLELDDPQRDWQYCQFHPWGGVVFEPVGEDDSLCELVVKPNRLHAPEGVQSVFENWPDASEYRSKDIFARHPKKKDLWTWYSRTDDVVTLETGEKLNPLTMENIISAHPKVKAAVVVGQRRMQPALLVEPVEKVSDKRAFLQDLWPTIQEANAVAPAYGQLVKQLVLISEEPFKRTPKGTIQRMQTEELLAEEIAGLYDGTGEAVYSAAVDLESQAEVQNFVHTIVHDVLDLPHDLDEDSNLFDHGLDSLRAAELVRAANVVLKSCVSDGHAAPRIDVSIVYNDPTIKNLSGTIFDLASSGGAVDDGSAWAESAKRLLARHIPVLATGAAILTGSTGSLGVHLLHLLLHDDTHTHVYCLNRSDTAKKVFVAAFPADEKLLHKVTFLQTSAIWSHFLGLPGEIVYRELLNNIRTVIHNAWPVNFLMALEAANSGAYSSSFEPQFDGVANLIRFCAESTYKARLVYISSITSVVNSNLGPVPEAIVTDPTAPTPGGYARSKWTTECIMDAVGQQHPNTLSQPIVVRPGQISGPLKDSVQEGASGTGITWNAREAVASLFISSAAIGALPSSIGSQEKLRWVPVDIVAKTILDIIHHVDSQPPSNEHDYKGASAWNVMNIPDDANAKEQTWNGVVPVIKKRLEQKFDKTYDVVPMADWIKRVEAYGVSEDNPAVKLADFLQSLVESSPDEGLGTDIATQRTKEASESFRNLGPVQPEWIEHWMEGWGL